MTQKIGFLTLVLWLLTGSCTEIKDKEIRYGKDRILYAEARVEESVARGLGDFLKRDGYFDGSGMRVKLDREQDSFWVYFQVDTGAAGDSLYQEMLREYTGTLCREVFSGAGTGIILVDSLQQEMKRIPCILAPEVRKKMSRVEVRGNLMYFSSLVDTSDALTLSAFLVRDSFFTGGEGMITEFDRTDGAWVFRFPIAPGTVAGNEYGPIADEYAQRLSDSVFQGTAVSIELCNRDMRPVYRSGGK